LIWIGWTAFLIPAGAAPKIDATVADPTGLPRTSVPALFFTLAFFVVTTLNKPGVTFWPASIPSDRPTVQERVNLTKQGKHATKILKKMHHPFSMHA
jgi:hypothetical protein